jgi:quinol-cytochrome oxidoreductase complex cytochrome b subunit
MPYYILKDILSLIVLLLALFTIIFLAPDWLAHSDNFNKANFLVTPLTLSPNGISFLFMQF